MQSILKAMGQGDIPDFKPILEINPDHEIIRKLESSEDESVIEDISFLLLEQAMIVEGVEIKDPNQFVARMNRVINKAV